LLFKIFKKICPRSDGHCFLSFNYYISLPKQKPLVNLTP